MATTKWVNQWSEFLIRQTKKCTSDQEKAKVQRIFVQVVWNQADIYQRYEVSETIEGLVVCSGVK